jgi:FkbM family methyltransferase
MDSRLIWSGATPNGNLVRLACRPETSDANIAGLIADKDEYRLGGRKFHGVAFDIGAHIGAVAIPLALDNPHLTVVAVEPVPENAQLLRRNIDLNRVGSQVIADEHALGTDLIEYGWHGRHRFIGNLDNGGSTSALPVTPITLTGLFDTYRFYRATLIKLDCEGCEWDVLNDPAVDRCDLIVGEWHDEAEGPNRIRAALEATHSVQVENFNFWAEHR